MATLYGLDDNYVRTEVIDQYESLIWTERYSAFGDITLNIASTPETRALLKEGKKLSYSESFRSMTIETVTDAEDANGVKMLTCVGPSMEDLLNHRGAIKNPFGLTTTWTPTDTPMNLARAIFNKFVRDGGLDVHDIIPNYVAGVSLYPPSNIPEFADTFTLDIKNDSLYNIIKEIADAYEFGFRLYPDIDKNKIYFNVYTGIDRTSAQELVPPVIFSEALDNLQKTKELNSIAAYKNVAYVTAKNYGGSFRTVYDNEDSLAVSGFDRRIMMVTADDIDNTGLSTAEYEALLDKRGADELAKQRKVLAFDGEIPQNGKYKYGIDYGLGDLVEMRNSDQVTKIMRVTEQIFASDRNGERSYPTLQDVRIIAPGTWGAWDYNQVWQDATGFWNTQP